MIHYSYFFNHDDLNGLTSNTDENITCFVTFNEEEEKDIPTYSRISQQKEEKDSLEFQILRFLRKKAVNFKKNC